MRGKWAGIDCVGHKTGVMQTNGGEYRCWFFGDRWSFYIERWIFEVLKTSILRYRQFLQRSQTFWVLLSIFRVMFGLYMTYFVFMRGRVFLCFAFDLFIVLFMIISVPWEYGDIYLMYFLMHFWFLIMYVNHLIKKLFYWKTFDTDKKISI